MIQSRGRVSSLDDVWQAFLPPLPSASIPVKDTRGEDADLRLVYAGVSRLPPPSSPTPATLPISEPTGPLRVALVLNTFAFGGSETEAIELIQGADPTALSFTGIAVAHPLRLPRWKSPADTPFPKLIMPPNPHIDPADTRIVIAGDFRAAVRGLVEGSDIIVSWGLARLQEYLPPGSRPPLVAVSKDSGDWARSVLYPNALGTRHLVANSSTSAEAFPRPVRTHVHVIHNGINPNRIEARLSRAEQRHAWGLSTSDPVVGYLGRIEHDKGVDKVVAAVAQLPSEWKAVFIGVTPNSRYTGELKRACEQVLPRRYRLLGWTHDVGSALAAFDVFCHPSEHEGFSNSIGEAWLAGVPTVYTANTGAVGDVGELGVSVSPTADG